MGATEKYSRYRWKEGREKDLWSFVDGRVREGVSVTAALKEYGKRNNMSWLTARWKYYQVRKQQGTGEQRPVLATPQDDGRPFSRDEEDFLGYLSEFVASSRDYGQDVVPFIKGLSRMAVLSKEGTTLRQDRDRRLAALREDAAVISEVCGFLRDWLSLSQVDRVASLKGFSDRLGSETERLSAVRDRLAASS